MNAKLLDWLASCPETFTEFFAKAVVLCLVVASIVSTAFAIVAIPFCAVRWLLF